MFLNLYIPSQQRNSFTNKILQILCLVQPGHLLNWNLLLEDGE